MIVSVMPLPVILRAASRRSPGRLAVTRRAVMIVIITSVCIFVNTGCTWEKNRRRGYGMNSAIFGADLASRLSVVMKRGAKQFRECDIGGVIGREVES